MRPFDEAEDEDRARLEIPDEMLDSTEAHDRRLKADLIDEEDFADLLGDFSRGELSGVVVEPALTPGGVLVSEESVWLTAAAGGMPSVMRPGGGPAKRRPAKESSAEEDPGEKSGRR